MVRTYVVTGSASGIGQATCSLLESQGHRVVDVDLHDATIVADLATAAGRRALVDEVTAATGGAIDVVIANAGTQASPELCVRVNHFGAVATCVGLRPLLAGSPEPRVVVTASSSVLNGHTPELVEACLAGEEERAVALSLVGHELLAYPSTKRALARWVRRSAVLPEWAGAGIALNAVAPGIVETPLLVPLLGDPVMVELMDAAVPMPLGGRCQPEHVAEVIAFLAAPTTQRIAGQVLFVDGGADAVLRGDDAWGPAV
ncbi:MAG TPA: SDR family oxidoreductase [Iamia sp.]|nr:SDR family oxidoreductase [Iamia sp.]